MTWTKISPEQAHTFYKVSKEQAFDKGNAFFGIKAPINLLLDMEGPWPFLAIMGNESSPDVISVSFHTIEPEALAFANFDPITDSGGYLTLSEQELSDMVTVLSSYSEHLIPTNDNLMFTEVQAQEANFLNLELEHLSNIQISYYKQMYDPLVDKVENTSIRLLVFRTYLEKLELYFTIRQFPLGVDPNSKFNPWDDSIATIHLNYKGLQEFITLLKHQQSRLSALAS